MDSKGFIPISAEKHQEILEKCKTEFSDDERKKLEQYSIYNESIDEIYQLYRSFRFNLSLLSDNYDIRYDDHIIADPGRIKIAYNDQYISISAGEDIDFYAINTYTSNIVSSGKNLIERINLFFKEDLEQEYDNFRNQYSSKEYDDNFSYRFLTETRNMVQHGHYIVSTDVESKFAFDFKQILSLPHYHMTKRIKDEISTIQHDLDELTNYERPAKLAFTYTLDLYCVGLSKIYHGYYLLTKSYIKNLTNDAITILKNHPEMVLQKEETGAKHDVLFCNIFDENVHGIEIGYESYKKFRTYMREAFDEMNHFNDISFKNIKNKDDAK